MPRPKGPASATLCQRRVFRPIIAFAIVAILSAFSSRTRSLPSRPRLRSKSSSTVSSQTILAQSRSRNVLPKDEDLGAAGGGAYRFVPKRDVICPFENESRGAVGEERKEMESILSTRFEREEREEERRIFGGKGNRRGLI